MMTPLITILDDTLEIRSLLSAALTDAGFETRSFSRASEFEQHIPKLTPALCIIDLGLPDKDGLAVVANMAAQSGAAILIISGRSNLQDKIVGLELGADDYITKPFEMAEVVARVKALLRRGRGQPVSSDPTMSFQNWTVDLNQLQLTHDDGTIERLSHAESQLLRMFLAQPKRLITRDQMLDALSDGAADTYDRAIDVRVSRLRSKLRDDPNDPQVIKTVYGAGYIFIADVTSGAD